MSAGGTQTRKVLGAVDVDRDSNASVAAVHKRNLRAVRATIFGITNGRLQKQEDSGRTTEPSPRGAGTASGQTKAREVDTFARLERAGKIVKPPFDPLLLAVMPENSTELGPAIDAMAVNCEAFGWRLEPRIPINEMTPIEVIQDLAEEAAKAENFFESCCTDDSYEDLREKARRDFEATGMFYTEFLEIPGTGELDGLNHLPAWTMRLGRLDNELVEYIDRRVEKKVRIVQLEDPEIDPTAEPSETPGLDGAPDLENPKPDGDVEESTHDERKPIKKLRFRTEVTYEIVEHRRFKRFRRYVQKHEGRTTYFKEYGDPRIIDSRKGEAVGRNELLENHGDGAVEEPRFTIGEGDDIVIRTGTIGFPVRWAANSVKHLDLYSTRSSYGLPRYIGNLFSIFGSRAADEVNYVTFKNQNIPNLAITISNGQLTDETGERIDEFLESIQSDDNYSKILVLEAEPVMEGMRDPGTVKIELHPLGKEQHSDAMFVNYQKNNDERTRRAWRFPPIFVGKSEDFTGKTIDASRKLADEQVFGPERNRFDRFWTRWVLIRLGIVWSTFKANSPNVAENADLVRLLAQGEKTGGLTPRIARALIGRVVNEDLGDIDSDIIDPDAPFSLTLAKLMKSNSATDAPGGGEPTSQGSSGLQVGDSERDRDLEAGSFEEDQVDRLQAMLRAEVASRFGGFVPSAFLDDFDEEEAGE